MVQNRVMFYSVAVFHVHFSWGLAVNDPFCVQKNTEKLDFETLIAVSSFSIHS